MNKLLLDLCSGMEGVSNVARKLGWKTITVDINPEFNPDICADILQWEYIGETPLVIWASPDCTQFAKDSFPKTWACNRISPAKPDPALMLACKRIIDQVKPRFWIIENVRGSVKHFTPHLGDYNKKIGNQYLWGNFPIFDTSAIFGKEKIGPCKNRPAIRSMIPEGITKSLLSQIEIILKNENQNNNL